MNPCSIYWKKVPGLVGMAKKSQVTEVFFMDDLTLLDEETFLEVAVKNGPIIGIPPPVGR